MVRSLFFYGTLLDGDVFAITAGVSHKSFLTERALLPGYRLVGVKGQDFPILEQDSNGMISGLVVHGLSDEQVARIHFYESLDYTLERVSVHKKNTTQEVYLFKSDDGRIQSNGKPWQLTEWQARNKALLMAILREVMPLYGTMGLDEIDAHWNAIEARLKSQKQPA